MRLRISKPLRKVELIALILLFCSTLSLGQYQKEESGPNANPIAIEDVEKKEAQLNRLLDSINLIQQQLIGMIETEKASISVKEKAVNVLAKIKNEEVITYLLINEKKLRFGDYQSMYDDYDGESARTAMLAIYREYLSPGKVNWMVFPYLLKYVDEVSYTEIGIVRELYGYDDERFKEPRHLLRFMKANATPNFQSLITDIIIENDQIKKRN